MKSHSLGKPKRKITIAYEKPPIEKKLNAKLELLKKLDIESKSKEKKKNNFPQNYEKVWNLFSKMRKLEEAPVDTMGVSKASISKDPKIYKFQTLVSLILSSQTKDPTTFAAMQKLIDYGLTPENICKMDEQKLKEMIYGVNFHNNKCKYIKELAKQIKEKYNSDPPENYEDIVKFKGMGPKMTYLYLQVCCGKVEGIAVDVHVHRVSNRIKWVENTKNPEETRKSLQSWLPKEKWADINELLVGIGQTICFAKNPQCNKCDAYQYCDYGKNRKKQESKSKNKISVIDESNHSEKDILNDSNTDKSKKFKNLKRKSTNPKTKN